MAGSNARGTGQQHNRELSPGLSQGTDTQGDPPVPGTRPALPWGRFLEETGRLSLGRGRVRTQPGSWFCSQTVPGNACVLSQAGTGDMRCATSPRTHRHRAVMVRALYTLLRGQGLPQAADRWLRLGRAFPTYWNKCTQQASLRSHSVLRLYAAQSDSLENTETHFFMCSPSLPSCYFFMCCFLQRCVLRNKCLGNAIAQ